jgi:hypothetical protein
MRRIGFLVVALLLLSSAEVFGQCQKCETSYGCLTCVDTFYNANILCTISGNGSICVGQGQCDGLAGECKKGCILNQVSLPTKDIRARENRLKNPEEHRLAGIGEFRRLLQSGRKWQLVSFKIIHVKARS